MTIVADRFEQVFDTGTVSSKLDSVVSALRSVVQQLHPGDLTPDEAAALVSEFAEIERLGAAGKTIVARVVERSGVWKSNGHRTAAHWVAEKTGVAVGQAVGTLETGRRLEHLPETADAFRSGELSEIKVREVAAAAVADRASERTLLKTAKTQSLASLREQCQHVRARATIDENESYERIRRSRYLRHWVDIDGAFRLDARLTADDGAGVLAGIKRRQERIATEARKAGRTEPSDAYAADALVALATDAGTAQSSGPGAVVHLRVDHSALMRGHRADDEICEVPGIGPIPVSAARRLSSDSILKVLVTDGTDIKAVAHAGRTIPAKVRTAIEARDPSCVVRGCDVRDRLEIDHIVPFAEGGQSSLTNLARLCRWHHYLKTHHGHRLEQTLDGWDLIGPDPPA